MNSLKKQSLFHQAQQLSMALFPKDAECFKSLKTIEKRPNVKSEVF